MKMCRSLAAAGHETHLVVATDDINDCQLDGVFIHPVGRAKNRFERMMRTVHDVFAKGMSLDGDVYHFHDPECLLSAYRFRKRKPFVYDIHENYRSQLLVRQWIPDMIRKPIAFLAGLMEDRLAPACAGVIVVSSDEFIRLAEYSKKELIVNYPLLDELVQRQRNPVPGRFVYLGSVDAVRGVKEMVQAVGLANTGSSLGLAGRFSPQSLRDECALLLGWDRVHEAGFLNRDGVRGFLSQAVCGLALLHARDGYGVIQPTKLFEYMAAGLPIIASDFSLCRKIVSEAQCGLLVDPHNPMAIAGAMNWIMEHPEEAEGMGRNGRKAVEGKYNWEAELPKLLRFYETVLNDWKRK